MSDNQDPTPIALLAVLAGTFLIAAIALGFLALSLQHWFPVAAEALAVLSILCFIWMVIAPATVFAVWVIAGRDE